MSLLYLSMIGEIDRISGGAAIRLRSAYVRGLIRYSHVVIYASGLPRSVRLNSQPRGL